MSARWRPVELAERLQQVVTMLDEPWFAGVLGVGHG